MTNYISIRALLLLGLLSLVPAGRSRAELVLHVNSIDKVFFITGDTTGTTAGDIPHVIWELTGTGGSGNITQSLITPTVPADAITFDQGTTSRFDLILESSGPTGAIRIEDEGVASTLGTFTGTSNLVDYSGWNNAAQTSLEDIATTGTPMSLVKGTGFDLQFQVSLIPEPSGVVLTGSFLLIGLALQRQRARG